MNICLLAVVPPLVDQVEWMKLAIGWVFTGIVICTAVVAFISLVFNQIIPDKAIRSKLWYSLIIEIVVASATMYTGLIKVNPSEDKKRISETETKLQSNTEGATKELHKLAQTTDDIKERAVSEDVKAELANVSRSARLAAIQFNLNRTEKLRISFLVNSSDIAASQRIDSLRSEFEAMGFEWQPPRKNIQKSPDVTEIRVAGAADRPLADKVRDELKQKCGIEATIDPENHPDVGSGYVQVSLSKGALK